MNGSIYEVEVFKEEGFIRKKCIKCGRYFWSLNPDQELCSDQPCVEYGFIGNPPKARKLDKREFRGTFLGFFEKNGHSIVRRYPVVARWREDVYFVGASIYDFQPWVTSGVVPPPANPLVISQPSIRFTDLENVGRTGRHLTGFEMMAHHAFNINGRYVYWNNETVEYCFRFYKEVVQVNPEELTFIEDLWSGGGNAGEDFEVLVRGGEIATLVFMHYETGENGTLKPINNMIVDTGYGLERNVWVFSGKPNIYEAIYGDLVEKVRVEAGVEKVDERILLEVSKTAGILSVGEKGLEEIRNRIVAKTGLTLEEVERILKPYELIYKLVDYSYALAWILGDGVVASNTGAGYLVRLLIRRCLRAIDELKLNVEIGWTVSQHLKNLALDFPELLEAEDKIMEMLELEAKRYRESISKALNIAIRALKDAKKPELTLKDLILLYDSHGLPPDLLKERLAPTGIKVEVPQDFYGLVAKIHEKPVLEKTTEEELKLSRETEGLPKTRRIYYEDDVVKFKSKVLRVLNDWVVLDSTAFYPTSGGQLHDTGVLKSINGTAKVVDVRDVNGVIVHKVDGVMPAEGEHVECEVDMDRRRSLARHHTATHIILGAARKILGPHVWQSGAEKTVEKARLDITHYKGLTLEEVEAIEMLTNRIIMENRLVRCFFTSRDDAEKKYGFRLYQGGVYPGRTIRVVEVENWDVEACGGIHCKRTGEVGFVKIIGVDRIQDGVERIEYVAGEQALKYVQQKFRLLGEVSDSLKSTPDKLKDSILGLLRDFKLERGRVENLTRKLVEVRLDLLAKNMVEIDGIKLIVERRIGEELDLVINEANTLVNRFPEAVAVYFIVDGERSSIVVMVGDKARGLGLNAGAITRNIATLCDGRGGGTVRLGQGGGLNSSKIPTNEKIIEEILRVKS
ncbi:MAG: alanine--tRNA ligase [Candidatus Bathyarchaeia archaeon]